MTKPSADGIAFGAVTRREISAGPSRVMTPPADRARISLNFRGSSWVGSGGVKNITAWVGSDRFRRVTNLAGREWLP